MATVGIEVHPPIAGGVADLAVLVNDNAPAVRSDPSPRATCAAVLQQRVSNEVRLSAMDWFSVQALYRTHHRMPTVASCEATIVRTLDGQCFAEFSVVLARTLLTLNIHTKRIRDEGMAATDGTCDAAAPSCRTTLEFCTLHFVHRFKEDVGYEVQSVWVPGQPLQLQCYARLNLQFALLMFMRAQYGAPPGPGEAWDVARLSPPRRGDVVILGMGGNVMANCLVRLLPEAVKIRVVEIEPSVVAMCTMEGLLPDASNFACHIADVAHALEQLDDASCALIVLDCFDPLAGDMMAHKHWLSLIRQKLHHPEGPSGGCGVLVVNVHCAATPKELHAFTDVFGDCVEVLELDSTPPQIVVVCGRSSFACITRDVFCGLAKTANNAATFAAGVTAATNSEGMGNKKHLVVDSFGFDPNIVSGYRTLRVPPSMAAPALPSSERVKTLCDGNEEYCCRVWRRTSHR